VTDLQTDIVPALAGIVGDSHVLTDPALRAGYEVDWTGRFRGRALAVVRPADLEQTCEVLHACHAARVPVVPQGGNTGLVGGSVPSPGSVVLSLSRLTDLEAVDLEAGEVTAAAGVTIAAVQERARSAGLEFGVDFGARDSATVGGAIATNAGGIRVLRHGPMRAQLVGIEAVLADGTVVRRLPGMMKDNTGYHLPSLLAGSEGTLAVITRVRLRLLPRLARRVVAVAALAGTGEAVALMARLRATLPALAAAELFFDDGLELVLSHARLERPFGESHPAYLLVECAAVTDPTDELTDALGSAAEVRDAVMAGDAPGRERLWQLRERQSEAVAAAGIPHKLDVSVPIGRMAAFETRVRDVVEAEAPGTRTILWGHVGDGNLHVNLLGPAPDDDRVDEAVLRLVVEMGGSISAEHGIGRAKVRWLSLDRRPEDLAAMRAIKDALDPAGILNPGVLFPAGE